MKSAGRLNVVCWAVIDKERRIVEVYYVGTSKKPRTKEIEITFHGRLERHFRLPQEKATGLLRLISELEVKDDDRLIFLPMKSLRNSIKKYGKAGSILRGLRAGEELTQVDSLKKSVCHKRIFRK